MPVGRDHRTARQRLKDDPDAENRVYLDLTRTVIDIGAEDNPLHDGGRFFVEDTTKGGHDRRVGLSVAMTDKLLDYLDRFSIGDDELLFPLSRLTRGSSYATGNRVEPTTMPDGLGHTEPNAQGRSYQHGTIAAYSLGTVVATGAASPSRRTGSGGANSAWTGSLRGRPSAGRTSPTTSPATGSAHVWKPRWTRPTWPTRRVFHDLRHTHATWLARSHKVDIERLRERMGHRSIVTTQQYISASVVVDTTAADVMEEILTAAPRGRHGSAGRCRRSDRRAQAVSFLWILCSGRRGRGFKSRHPDRHPGLRRDLDLTG